MFMLEDPGRFAAGLDFSSLNYRTDVAPSLGWPN
jgi:hypothetical protein